MDACPRCGRTSTRRRSCDRGRRVAPSGARFGTARSRPESRPAPPGVRRAWLGWKRCCPRHAREVRPASSDACPWIYRRRMPNARCVAFRWVGDSVVFSGIGLRSLKRRSVIRSRDRALGDLIGQISREEIAIHHALKGQGANRADRHPLRRTTPRASPRKNAPRSKSKARLPCGQMRSSGPRR